MVFNSKVDFYNIFSYLISSFLLILPMLVFKVGAVFLFVYVTFWALLVSIMGIILFSTHYRVEEFKLIIKSGFIKQVLSYEEITKLSYTKNYSPSCSTHIKSIEISLIDSKTKKSYKVFVSPLMEEKFVNEVVLRCNKKVVVTNKRGKTNG